MKTRRDSRPPRLRAAARRAERVQPVGGCGCYMSAETGYVPCGHHADANIERPRFSYSPKTPRPARRFDAANYNPFAGDVDDNA